MMAYFRASDENEMKTFSKEKDLSLRSMFLVMDEVDDFRLQCPICLYEGQRVQNRKLQNKPDINLLFCPCCKGVSASHMPKDVVLDRYYNLFFNGFKHEKVTFQDSKKISLHILKLTKEIYKNKVNISILDFGGGDGTISYLLGKKIIEYYPTVKHVNIDLIDKATDSIKKSEDNIIFRRYGDLSEVKNKYDLVIASAVLEHLKNVNYMLLRLLSLIKSEGHFYARTPAVRYFGKTVEFGYPGHLHDMDGSFWNRVIDVFNLNAVLLTSRPSLVQTTFKKAFLKTLLSYLFKMPAHIERFIGGKRKDPLWKYVGGWEVVIKIK